MLDRFESQLSQLQTQCCCIIKLKLEVWRLRTFSLGHKERKILGGFLMMMPTLLQDHNLHKWIFHLMPFNFTQLSHHDITKITKYEMDFLQWTWKRSMYLQNRKWNQDFSSEKTTPRISSDLIWALKDFRTSLVPVSLAWNNQRNETQEDLSESVEQEVRFMSHIMAVP